MTTKTQQQIRRSHEEDESVTNIRPFAKFQESKALFRASDKPPLSAHKSNILAKS